MNQTTIQESSLRDLAYRIARAQSSSAQLATERDMAIRQFGVGHPRAIDASRRLVVVQSAQRELQSLRRQQAGDLERKKKYQLRV